MKNFKTIIFILVIFLKTGNVLSENNLFSVNNIEILSDHSVDNETLANQAIEKGFNKLIERILLNEDLKKIKGLKFDQIKELVSFYQISSKKDSFEKTQKIFNINFDKDKLHKLFFEMDIPYSNIVQNEFYILPILKKKSQLFIYSQNYFYENWNSIDENKLIEFILPIENIETIQKLNSSNIIEINIKKIFPEYASDNLVIVLIDESRSASEKIFIKASISGKQINKSLNIKRMDLAKEEFYKKIIFIVKNEIINLVKSENMIDLRTPSFINTKFDLNKKNNLVELNNRIKKIDLIENIYVQEFNNKNVFLKIKYLGKIDKIIKQLNDQNISLELLGDSWILKII